MVKCCSAVGCSNYQGKSSCKEALISFHRFPLKDKELLKTWYAKIRRQNFIAKQNNVLCSEHFEEGEFEFQPFTGRRQLKKEAVPTIFSYTPVTSKRKRTSYEFGLNVSNKENDKPVDLHEKKDVGCQTEETDLSKLLKLLKEKDESIHQLVLQKLKLEFTFSSISAKGDNIFHSITGYSIKYFTVIFNFFKLDEALTSNNGAPKALCAIDQFLLTIVRLRHALSENFLSLLFHISQSTVSRTFNNCLEILYQKSINVDIWPHKRQVKAFMPPTFFQNFPSCRVIIDCTEFFIHKPSNPTEQQSSFSYYKNHNTVKSLIGIAPSGAITFISDLFNGAISDKELTMRSNIIDKLDPGDCVLADRGFTSLTEILEAKGCTLFTPNFLKDKIQFPLSERCENKNISSHRCHIERAISRIKNFQILNCEIPYNLLPIINEIHYVCAFLCNFSEKPLINVLQ